MKIPRLSKRFAIRVAAGVLAVLLLPYLTSRLLSPWRRMAVYSIESGQQIADEPRRDIQQTARTDFRVACFNIAHGRGTAHSNWDGGSKQDRLDRLERIAEFLKKVDADVVVLNEVDFDSSWSNHVNQARFLANRSGYFYWVEQRNLDFRFLFWTWRFGNAVLSKHPITDSQLVDLPSYSQLETSLAGKKRAFACDLNASGQKVRIVAAHLSHRSEALRVASAKMITTLTSKTGIPTVIAGDMNSTPPNFPFSETDSDGSNAIATFDASGDFRREPSRSNTTSVEGHRDGSSDHEANHDTVSEDQFTYRTTDPKSVIDWVFIPKRWRFEAYQVVPTLLSDHRLVVADISIADTP